MDYTRYFSTRKIFILSPFHLSIGFALTSTFIVFSVYYLLLHILDINKSKFGNENRFEHNRFHCISNIFTPHKKQLIKRKEDTIDIVVLRVLRRLTKHRIL